MRAGAFREDLYYRLVGLKVVVPPPVGGAHQPHLDVELAWRLTGGEPGPRVHVVVSNHGAHEAAAPGPFVRLLARLIT